MLAQWRPTQHPYDFFSGSGALYVIGRTENTADSDWAR